MERLFDAWLVEATKKFRDALDITRFKPTKTDDVEVTENVIETTMETIFPESVQVG
jgi:hypothetical protein